MLAQVSKLGIFEADELFELSGVSALQIGVPQFGQQLREGERNSRAFGAKRVLRVEFLKHLV
jgi:hypothetical protein